MGRNIGAGIAGVVVAGLLVWVVEMIGHSANPMPEGLDYNDREAMHAYITSLPVWALLPVVVAWIVGTFGGTLAACRIGTAPAYIFALLVGGFVLLGIGLNLAAFPHPTWMAIAGVIGTIAAAWLGMLLGGAKKEAV